MFLSLVVNLVPPEQSEPSCSGNFLCDRYVFAMCSILLLQVVHLAFLFINFSGPYFRNQTKKRISAYAELLAENDDCNSDGVHSCSAKGRNSEILCPCKHAILLGILKKIEQKNSAQIAVIVFMMTAFSTMFLDDTPWSSYGRAISISAFSLIIPLILSIGGVKHLDTHSFLYHGEKDPNFHLQQGLLNDLLFKESSFRFSYGWVLFSVCALAISIILIGLGWLS